MRNKLTALHTGYIYICLVSIWLLSSAALIEIESEDGISTIISSLHLVGATEHHSFNQRGPLFVLFLYPAAWLSNALDLHALDLRLYHYSFAFLHILYLVLVWQKINRIFPEKGILLLIVFASSITTFIFFSYSPFISHDIFPGLLLFCMLFLSHEYSQDPQKNTLCYLILIGAAAPLIKQTYALFWFAIIITSLIFVYLQPKDKRFYQLKLVGKLFLAACVSAAIAWLVYCWSVGFAWNDTPFLARPLEHIRTVSNHYQDMDLSELFPWWLYLINLHAYGILTIALILPGLYFSFFKGNILQKKAATIWLISIIAMHAIPFKEVRYLAFLSPLSAVIIFPAIESILSLKKMWFRIVLITLSVDLLRSANEAGNVSSEFYRNESKQFFSLIDDPAFSGTLYLAPEPFTRIFNAYSPLFADRFHRIFHWHGSQLRGLFHKKNFQKKTIVSSDVDKLCINNFKYGDIFIFANGNGVREPPWLPDNQVTWHVQNYFQGVSIGKSITLKRSGGEYVRADESTTPKPLLLIRGCEGADGQSLMFSSLPIEKAQSLYALQNPPDRIEVFAFELGVFCTQYKCEYF